MNTTLDHPITARDVATWIATLPPEFQDAPFYSLMPGGIPVTIKRLVAALEGKDPCVIVNPMGTHLPFEPAQTRWAHTLS